MRKQDDGKIVLIHAGKMSFPPKSLRGEEKTNLEIDDFG